MSYKGVFIFSYPIGVFVANGIRLTGSLCRHGMFATPGTRFRHSSGLVQHELYIAHGEVLACLLPVGFAVHEAGSGLCTRLRGGGAFLFDPRFAYATRWVGAQGCAPGRSRVLTLKL